jgi:hypothetical protein
MDIMKKMFAWKLFFILAIMSCIALIGCSTLSKPTETPAESQLYSVEEVNQIAGLYESWIHTLEPFVTQNKDGTFALDWDKCLSQIAVADPRLAGILREGRDLNDEARIILELRDGIPKCNEAILASGSGESTALGSWCNYYWWGRKCCYTGSTAYNYIMYASWGSIVPPAGLILGPFVKAATYLTDRYGGFCINQTYVGGVWLTAP